MQINKKLNNLNKLYIYFFSSILFINIIFLTPLNANSFKIIDLEISEPFKLNFNKEKVIDRGFKEAFQELISKITTSGDNTKIKNTNLTIIKNLIDSFTMSNERFINETYIVNFDVNFNKKNTLFFFNKRNIFPSIPIKKNLVLLPILVDLQSDEVFLFSNNIFYDQWNDKKERYDLLNYLLPTEDIEDLSLISLNSKSIEDYSFQKIIKKYDIDDYIIVIIYKNKKELQILSKMNLNQSFKINNKKFENIDLLNEKDFYIVLQNLKITYEDYWKKINQINTSIKLPLTISINANDHSKIKVLEDILIKLDLVANYEIVKFDSENIYLKIIYNGPPNKFINEMKEEYIFINTEKSIWTVK
tara:strand:- start:580 stop:1659 length:1080 start_codon:yes stop_codon:yes gene_type:complete